jgi:uncharacterized membrane protein YhiD involved in acid resistance
LHQSPRHYHGTLWIVTVIGLCFGGGQLGLGILATLLAGVVLWAFKALEHRMHEERQGILILILVSGNARSDMKSRNRASRPTAHSTISGLSPASRHCGSWVNDQLSSRRSRTQIRS